VFKNSSHWFSVRVLLSSTVARPSSQSPCTSMRGLSTQDIFLKMWQILPDYDGRASISTWLYTIARNTALSALRAESYRKTWPIEGSDPPAINGETGLRQLEIRQLLQRLPEAQQRVITLFYLQDCSVEEVARMLDLPEGTVKSHLHRGRRALADLVRS